MRQGFSLVELSIVLVILGLITGGILAGQNLIRAAELRSITTEYSNLVTAANTFRDKYQAIPGDFRGATEYWGHQVVAAHCPNNSGAAVTTTGVCDGNGNGQINVPAAANESGDRFQFWRHLANAGMIEGSYTGLAGPASSQDHLARTNAQAGKISQSVWSPLYRGNNLGSPGVWFAGDYGNELAMMGWANGVGTNILKPEEVRNIDTKMDDGKPARGIVMPLGIANCTDAGAAAGSELDFDAEYLLTSNAVVCRVFFLRAF